MSATGFRDRWAADTALAIPAIDRVDLYVFRAPIAEPVRTSFGTMMNRPSVLVEITDKDGAIGWGEIWCNYPVCGAEHRARLAAEVVGPHLLGRSFTNPPAAYRFLADTTRILSLQTREFGPLDQVIAGFDLALWDLVARRQGRPLSEVLSGAAQPRQVPVYASGINPGGAVETVERARASGFGAFKVKIGFDPEQDRRVVAALAEQKGARERLMVDANQAWDLERAKTMVAALEGFELDWLEEPMPVDAPSQAWQTLASASRIPLAGGENLASEAAFRDVAEAGWLSVIQPDLAKWGGISCCLPIADGVVDAGRRYCPHYLGGGIGLMASAHALAAVRGDGLLEVDYNQNPLRELLATPFPSVSHGQMTMPTGPGLGVVPDLVAVRDWETLCLSA